jgi:predicted dithiol-disulfide oxidoreductase (DUF899 family)
MADKAFTLPKVVSRDEWLTARKELLAKEDELTKARDALNVMRQELPMVEVDKDYVFMGVDGKAGLLDMFEGRHQLITHHVMWLDDEAQVCPHCTMHMSDLGHLPNLHDADTTLAIISRGPQDQLEADRLRKGWAAPCYSSQGSDFNYDYHVSLDKNVAPVLMNYEAPESEDVKGDVPAVSVFVRDDENRVFHTYSLYMSGMETLIFTMMYLDLTPRGR